MFGRYNLGPAIDGAAHRIDRSPNKTVAHGDSASLARQGHSGAGLGRYLLFDGGQYDPVIQDGGDLGENAGLVPIGGYVAQITQGGRGTVCLKVGGKDPAHAAGPRRECLALEAR
jgi:hypothetical protein